MSIPLKSSEEINKMREGGKILATILQTIKDKAEVGITTFELDEIAENLFQKFQVKASFKGYQGFPANICACVNDEVVHGIPNDRKLKKGDILSIDCGVYHLGFHTDSAITFPIETITPDNELFIKTVQKALDEGIKMAKPGNKVGDISAAIELVLKNKGYSPVKELTGHGIGKNLHEVPHIPNFGKKGSGAALKPGMTLAIEPIVNMGNRAVMTLDDQWTIVTRDTSLAAQIEHTIAITNSGNEILTTL